MSHNSQDIDEHVDVDVDVDNDIDDMDNKDNNEVVRLVV